MLGPLRTFKPAEAVEVPVTEPGGGVMETGTGGYTRAGSVTRRRVEVLVELPDLQVIERHGEGLDGCACTKNPILPGSR